MRSTLLDVRLTTMQLVFASNDINIDNSIAYHNGRHLALLLYK
jgi:hypothetical protein